MPDTENRAKQKVNKKGRTVRKFSIVSMFSGCGGMDLGFKGGFEFLGKQFATQPYEFLWSNDLNPFACATYEKNLGHSIKVGSVWDHLESLPSSCDVIVGGFPCQDISINGKRAGVEGARSGLYRAMVDAVGKLRPKLFVAENVRGLLYAYNAKSLKQVITDFSALGYDVSFKLYNTANYGVPQRRERVIIVGVRDGQVAFEPPVAQLHQKNWIASRDAIRDLELAKNDADFSHIWSLARKSSDQGGRILQADKVAHTVRAECHGNNQFHYSLPRRISMREAARFQSFPDSFQFQAKLRETERMIGNAVPPVFAWHIAEAIKKALLSWNDVQLADAA